MKHIKLVALLALAIVATIGIWGCNQEPEPLQVQNISLVSRDYSNDYDLLTLRILSRGIGNATQTIRWHWSIYYDDNREGEQGEIKEQVDINSMENNEYTEDRLWDKIPYNWSGKHEDVWVTIADGAYISTSNIVSIRHKEEP